MQVIAIKTQKITPGQGTIYDILKASLPTIHDGDIVVITSKIVSICEGSVIPVTDIDKEELVVNESDLYLPATLSRYGHHFTITNHSLIPMAGVDESNGEGYYVLWPKQAQQTANEIRQWLLDTYSLIQVGVVITDSTCSPMRRGTAGISLAHSGFLALKNYVGTPDLFGKPLAVTQANLAGGLAAAAVVTMGEGAEQTPLCLISDAAFITFQSRNPSPEELAETTISLEDDLFAPFLTSVNWQVGRRA